MLNIGFYVKQIVVWGRRERGGGGCTYATATTPLRSGSSTSITAHSFTCQPYLPLKVCHNTTLLFVHTMRTLQPQNLYKQPASFVGPIAKRTRSRCQERVRTIQKTWNASVDSVEQWGQAPYILRGYRVGLSVKETFLSMFVLHNETLNVWTHLIGCLYFAGALAMRGAVPEDIAVAEQPTWPIAIFMITAALCMGISAFFHLLLNYNYKLNQITSKLDYAGISLLVMGSFFPLLQYGFCNDQTRMLYLTGLSFLTCFMLTFAAYDYENKIFGGNRVAWYRFRNFSFFCQGVYGIFPFGHQIINHCTGYNPMYVASFFWCLAMGTFYVGGMFVMMKRYPESLSSRGRFDFFLSSHQIWHCCVFVAALIWLRGVRAMYIWRATHQCEAAALQGWA